MLIMRLPCGLTSVTLLIESFLSNDSNSYPHDTPIAKTDINVSNVTCVSRPLMRSSSFHCHEIK